MAIDWACANRFDEYEDLLCLPESWASDDVERRRCWLLNQINRSELRTPKTLRGFGARRRS